MIRVRDLVKSYPGSLETAAVDGVSFTVEEGHFYTLLGPSGCGKTTTLRCIAGLERPNNGTIELGDTVVVSDSTYLPTYSRDLGVVFQSYAVWPHMTVFENVAFPLRVQRPRMSSAAIRARVSSSLELVGMSGLDRRMATQLSGGQQQRLSLARAIVREPKVLLLDEPLSNLDAKLRERMRAELSLLQRRLGVTTVFVTHDQVEALSMSDRVAVMNQGKIVQEGTPRQIYHAPESEFVANFIGTVNVIPGRLVVNPTSDVLEAETQFGRLICGQQAPGLQRATDIPIVVAVRPEDIVIHRGDHQAQHSSQPANTFDAVVEIGLFSGTSVDYHLVVGDARLLARVGSRVELGEGDRVSIELVPSACRIYSPEAGLHRATVEEGETVRTPSAPWQQAG